MSIVSTQTTPNATIDWRGIASAYLADHPAQVSATADLDIFEIHGDWIKRQCRTEWLIARQRYNAAVRATRADRDNAKHPWARPRWPWMRPSPPSSHRIQCRPRRDAVASNGEGDDHDAR